MKKKAFFITALLLLTLLPMMQAARKLTKISFLELTHDFGTIYEKNGNASCTFRFVNTGTTPLVIIRAQASCGCTVPTYPEQPIAPGDTAEIKVTYQTHNRPGEFLRYIFVYSNTNPDRTVLQIKGTVIPDNEENEEGPSSQTSQQNKLRTRAKQG